MQKSSLPVFADSIYAQFIATVAGEEGNTDILTDPIEVIEALHSRAHHIRSENLQLHGVGPAWERADKVCRFIREVIKVLEDILCYAMSDPAELIETHAKRSLMYQSSYATV